jgi:hypothetical protein
MLSLLERLLNKYHFILFHKNENKNKNSFADKMMVGWEVGHKNNWENGDDI